MGVFVVRMGASVRAQEVGGDIKFVPISLCFRRPLRYTPRYEY